MNDPKTPPPSGSKQPTNKTQVFILTPEMLRKMGIASQIPNLEHVTKSAQQIPNTSKSTPTRKMEPKQKIFDNIKNTEIITKKPDRKNEEVMDKKDTNMSQEQNTKNAEALKMVEKQEKLSRIKQIPDQSSIDKSISISPNLARRQSLSNSVKSKYLDNEATFSVRKSTRKRKLSNLLDDYVTDLKIYDGSDTNTRKTSVDNKEIKMDKSINNIDNTISDDMPIDEQVSDNFATPKSGRTYTRTKRAVTPNILNINPTIPNTSGNIIDTTVLSKEDVSEVEILPISNESVNCILKSNHTDLDILNSQQNIPNITELQVAEATSVDSNDSEEPETLNFDTNNILNKVQVSNISNQICLEAKLIETPIVEVSETSIQPIDNQSYQSNSETKEEIIPIIPKVLEPIISIPPEMSMSSQINTLIDTDKGLFDSSSVELKTPTEPQVQDNENILIIVPDKIDVSVLQTALENALKYLKTTNSKQNISASHSIQNNTPNSILVQPHNNTHSLLQSALEETTVSSSKIVNLPATCEINLNENTQSEICLQQNDLEDNSSSRTKEESTITPNVEINRLISTLDTYGKAKEETLVSSYPVENLNQDIEAYKDIATSLPTLEPGLANLKQNRIDSDSIQHTTNVLEQNQNSPDSIQNTALDQEHNKLYPVQTSVLDQDKNDPDTVQTSVLDQDKNDPDLIRNSTIVLDKDQNIPDAVHITTNIDSTKDFPKKSELTIEKDKEIPETKENVKNKETEFVNSTDIIVNNAEIKTKEGNKNSDKFGKCNIKSEPEDNRSDEDQSMILEYDNFESDIEESFDPISTSNSETKTDESDSQIIAKDSELYGNPKLQVISETSSENIQNTSKSLKTPKIHIISEEILFTTNTKTGNTNIEDYNSTIFDKSESTTEEIEKPVIAELDVSSSISENNNTEPIIQLTENETPEIIENTKPEITVLKEIPPHRREEKIRTPILTNTKEITSSVDNITKRKRELTIIDNSEPDEDQHVRKVKKIDPEPQEEISVKRKVGRPKRSKPNTSDIDTSKQTIDDEDSKHQKDNIDPEDETPVKKKVGRPRRIKENVQSDEEQLQTEPEDEIPVKKKIGKPRRIKKGDSDTEIIVANNDGQSDEDQKVQKYDAEPEDEIPVKKKVGRPRRIREEVSDTEKHDLKKDDTDPEEETPVKKKVGRPRKIKEDDDDESITEQPKVKTNACLGRPKNTVVKPKPPTIIKGMATCAVCNAKLKLNRWSSHKLKHNNLAWLVGADEIDLNNINEVTKILCKLAKAKKKLSCEECGHKSKSAIGHLSHLDQCKKSKEEILANRIPCPLCQKKMLPVSLKVHMGVAHSEKHKAIELSTNPEDKPVTSPNSSGRGKREAAKKAVNLLQEVSVDDEDLPKKSPLKKTYRKMSDPPKPTVFGFFWKSYKKLESFSCKIKQCTFTTKVLKELQDHTNNCPELKTTDYVCSYCLFVAITEQKIVQHVKGKHLRTRDYDPDKEYKEDEDDLEEEEDEEHDEFDEVNFDIEKKNRSPLSNKKCTYKVAFLAKEKRMLHAVICSYPAAARWTMEFYEENYMEKLFEDLNIFKDNWVQLTSTEKTQYLPQLKESLAVKELNIMNTVPKLQGREHVWKHYKLFETTVCNDVITIFCGGPIWGLAWAPTPFTIQADQILAVSLQKSTVQNYKIGQSYAGQEIIQFWNFGPLSHKTQMTDTPQLIFSVLHDHGMIWHMEWCPSGCYQDSDKKDALQRLGLLALACSDGLIVIYAIPMPEEFSESDNLYKTKEKYRLITQERTEVKLGNWEYQATQLSWSKSKGHNYIAGGYNNGLVSLWNLQTTSPLLRFEEDGTIILKPYLTFQAHYSAISALVLHPLDGGKRWLFTGSWDKSLKYWDLNNITSPITSYKRGLTTDAVWMTHWLTTFVTFDDVFNLTHTVTTAQNVRDFFYKQSSAMASNSIVHSISGNDWANAFAQVSGAGQLVGSFPRQMLVSFDEKGLKCKRILFGYTELIDKTLLPKERIDKLENTSKKNDLDFSDKDDKYIFQYLMNKGENKFEEEPDTYEEAQQKYGIIFCDINLLKFEKIPKETQNWVGQSSRMPNTPLELYPLTSINRVAWNPNLQSYLYLATGYQTGFVRIRCVRCMYTKYSQIPY